MTNLSNCIIEIHIGFLHCKLSRYGRKIMICVDSDEKNLYTKYWTLKIRDSLFYIELVFEENIREISCETRMHSSRMRTACSNSRFGGVYPCMQWGRPPRCGPGDPLPRCGPGEPPGCGPGDPPGQTPQPIHWLWSCRPPLPDPSTSPLGVGLETAPTRPLNLPTACGPGDPLICEQNPRHV